LSLDDSLKVLHVNEVAQFHFGLGAYKRPVDFSQVLLNMPSLYERVREEEYNQSFEFGPISWMGKEIAGYGFRGKTAIWLISFYQEKTNWGPSFWLKQGERLGFEQTIQYLHDQVSPPLITLKMALRKFKTEKDEIRISIASIEAMEKLVNEANAQIRALFEKEENMVLSGVSLRERITDYCQGVNQLVTPTIQVYVGDLPEDLEVETTAHLLDTSKELIHNAVKYCEAKHIDFQLMVDDSRLILSVEDDGKGFKKEKVLLTSKGRGLKHIFKRTAKLGGTCIIESNPKEGTFISLQLPIKLQDHA